MNWDDNALLLSVTKKSSDTLLLHVFTEKHGRCKCLLSLKPDDVTMLLPGCDIRLTYSPGGLGREGEAEIHEVNNGIIADSRNDISIIVMGHVTATLSEIFALKEPTKKIFPKASALLQSLAAHDGRWALHYVVFEFAVLAELGASSNLERCRAAFRHGETIYISKKNGRAATREEAGAFLDRMLPVPGILMGARNGKLADLRHALELNEMLAARATNFEGEPVAFPESRENVIAAIRELRDLPTQKESNKDAVLSEDDRRRRLLAMRQLVVGDRSTSI